MKKEVNLRSQRKDEHVKHAINQGSQSDLSDFDKVHFIHQSLPSFNMEDVDLSTEIGEFRLPVPLYINAMTGGSEWTKSINEKLARVAGAAGIPMAVGSMHAALKNKELTDSYTIVREANPKGIIFANVGADISLEGAENAVKMIDADALQIHINAPQELIMPEGDRNFKLWRNNIESIVINISVPVIVKEIGFGMSRETLEVLRSIGIRFADVSGRGGTNFASIENDRRENKDMSYLSGWGISTVQSLLEAQSFHKDMHIMASGGVKSPLDAMKCLALGAKAVGMSKVILDSVENQGVEAAIEYVKHFYDQMRKISILINAVNIEEVAKSPLVFSPEILSWQKQRGLPENGRMDK